ncbi:MAG: FHA domain-containing protein [Lachnospiraceae bacterium]|nr:FHA domain-containing protein [Lachnospiraceae bacterium]
MRISYKRSLNRSYMMIEPEQMYSGYQLHMLRQNRISSLLGFQLVVADGRPYFWYEITGKTSFEHILESSEFTLEIFIRLVEALLSASRSIKPYLLEEEGILLLPETIYFDHDRRQISFAYYPGKMDSVMDSFRHFMESFLSRMRHEDETLVLAAYEVYQRATEDGFSLEDVLQLLYRHQEQPVKRKEEEEEAISENVPEEKWEEESQEDIAEENVPFDWKTFWSKRPGWLFQKKDENMEENPYVYTPEDYTSQIEDKPTEYLGVEESAQGILRYDGHDGLDTIILDHFPFLIGSSDQADAVLNVAGISRSHVRISREGDTYYIEDMNSTNGTWLNDTMLTYHNPEVLNMYDQVMIGRQCFVFL